VAAPARLVVVDDDAASRHALTQALDDAGFESDALSSGGMALAWLARNRPALVLLDLVMPPPDGYTVLRALRADSRTADVPVVVITSIDSDEELARAFEMGADDYIRKPFRPVELIARIRSQLRLRSYIDAVGRKEHDAKVVLELTQTLCSAVDFRRILFTVVRKMAEVASVTRCSIVLVRRRGDLGYVIAQSDDQTIRDLPLDLTHYPEIQRVMQTREPLVIEGEVARPFFDIIPAELPEDALRSIALFPIIFEDKAMGVLFLHGFSEAEAPGEHVIEFARTVASAVAIALRNARILRAMRDETDQVSFARAEAERRLSALSRYVDFFHAAADGIVVVGEGGQVLFSNPRAREIIGSAEELVRGTLSDLVDAKDHGKLVEIRQAFREGRPLPALDLALRRDGRILNVSCSAVLFDEINAVLVSFRDVTADRRNAAELVKTKDFLQRVIDASASAIISTDMAGTVLLWSRAAEQLCGYEAKEVVGRKNIRDIYPPGQYIRIRRLVHSRNHGGYGRLESHRTQALARDGSYVPVRLSAALIMANGRPVGCVSLVTDLREHLRVELRLNQAEEELRVREKETLIHELAGAAAHELNQPLTSVLGYGALVFRRSFDQPAVHSATGVIIDEAERMAAIVRKIGKITRYETKSYVGAARILDLDRSSEETSPATTHPPNRKKPTGIT
jgi:PAS domain S-box-containing protein